MPRGIYPRKPGAKRGPYHQHKGKGKQHRKLKPEQHIIGGLQDAFDWLRERGIDLLPPELRSKVDAVKTKRADSAGKSPLATE